jgi:hypothetical protein
MKQFHKMTRAAAVDYLRTLYYAQPKADWNKLVVGNVIMKNGKAWRITHIPPKRGFVTATNALTGEAEKLLRSKYDGDDLRVTDEPTLSILCKNHQDEIKKAMAAGISIGLKVQYDYPELFTPFPASWDEKRQEKALGIWRRINEMRAFNDRTLDHGWQFIKVDDLKARAERDIVWQEKYRAEVEAGVGIKKPDVIPSIVASVNETISDLKDEIENVDHLRKHLEKTL